VAGRYDERVTALRESLARDRGKIALHVRRQEEALQATEEEGRRKLSELRRCVNGEALGEIEKSFLFLDESRRLP